MSLFQNGQAAVLLFALTQSFVSASVDDELKRSEAWAKPFISSMEAPWINGIRSANSSPCSHCKKEILALSEGIDAHEIWALRMLDATSKIQSGILQGNLIDLGMYSQCVSVNGDHNGVNVRGKHCLVTFGSKNLVLTSSVCIPSSCNETQAAQILTTAMNDVLVNRSSGIEIKASGTNCARIKSEDFTAGEIWTIVLFSAIGISIILCTICDYVKRNWSEYMLISTVTTNILVKYSLYTNIATIFSTEIKPNTIPAINGIRFLSTCWAVLYDCYILTTYGPSVNGPDLYRWSNSWQAVWIQMSTLAIDNFFLISGFLTTYVFIKTIQSGTKLRLRGMYFDRYFKITPSVVAVILFVAVLYHRLGNGPLWNITIPKMAKKCQSLYWTDNIAFMQNFADRCDMCLPQTWFLSVDMQLFFISPIILYPLHYKPILGHMILSLFLVTSIITPTALVWFEGYTTGVRLSDTRNSFDYYYTQTYNRAFPYLLGILLAFSVTTKTRSLKQVTVAINWMMTCVIMILCCIAIHYLDNIDIEYNPTFEVICAATLRPCWSIAMAWVIYACIQGYGGLIARFLSMPIFMPLGRLSTGIYLVHLPIRIMRIGTSTIPGIFSDFEILNSYFGDMVLAIAVSGVISLFVKLPMFTLVEMLAAD